MGVVIFKLFLSLSFRYKAIVKYKTAFYSFYLPVAAAMYMVSVFMLYTHNRGNMMVMILKGGSKLNRTCLIKRLE